jgi:hypothetical protein
MCAYIASNTGDSCRKAASAKLLMPRSGWSVGTTDSSDIRHSMDDCSGLRPRMPR